MLLRLLTKKTFTKAVDVDSKYAKQSGGRGQYGHCKVKFEPMDANGEELYKFESTVVGGAIPKEYIPAVGEGIEEAMKSGILGGFPVVGIHANVYDGSYHEVDSSEMAFHIAGSLAFKDAMQKAAPVLLEPIMKVEVTTPEDYMGDVIGDINSRRGRIEGMDDIGGGKIDPWICTAFRNVRILLQTFVPEHRDVVTTQCSSRNMSRFRSLFRRRSYLAKRDMITGVFCA